MGSFDDLVTAQELESVMRRIAQEEIGKQRPPARYAVVTAINTADRSAMVRFVGETDSVRVVYTLPAPSVVGQEVRIAGSGSDRYIDAIRGTSDEQQRIADAEAASLDLTSRVSAIEATPAPGAFWFECSHVGGSTWRTDGAPTRDPNFTFGSFVGWSNDSVGVRCQNSGVYELNLDWTFSTSGFTGGEEVYAEIAIKNSLGGAKKYVTGRGVGAVTVSTSCFHQFDVGDYVQVNLWSSKWRDHDTLLSNQYNRLRGKYIRSL
ncbi:hypothetical protein Mbo2_025 [Rhodococcus phage Mbo2]|uniref:Minor tail protein n=1 Tax=Rhodococcus phage Mbo2 TaxID=2936911 RepID=A0A9E7LF20_9CAUD|nr:hypothetical protein Mbo2_025 [Rhodococcus phage Mbo2]